MNHLIIKLKLMLCKLKQSNLCVYLYFQYHITRFGGSTFLYKKKKKNGLKHDILIELVTCLLLIRKINFSKYLKCYKNSFFVT